MGEVTGPLQRNIVLLVQPLKLSEGTVSGGCLSIALLKFVRFLKSREDPKLGKFLFGDNLSSKLKISEENKLFNQVSYDHKTTRPKKSFKSSAANK